MRDVAAVVLAAGSSRRFGSDKLAHCIRLDGMELPLAAHALRPWLQAFARVTVVVRPDGEALQRLVGDALGQYVSRLQWLPCKNAAQGMAASLVAGVSENSEASGWLIGLADMPCVPLSAIAGVRDAIADGAALAAPFYAGRRGHPVGFSSRYYSDLLALQGDAGARQLLEREATQIHHITIENAGIFADIDQLSDLQTLEVHIY